MAQDTRIEDLQSVSQQILTDAERITQLEQDKRSVDPGSARFHALSDEIERLSEEIRRTSHAETALARDFEGEDGLPTIKAADARVMER